MALYENVMRNVFQQHLKVKLPEKWKIREIRGEFLKIWPKHRERLESAKDGGERDSKRLSGQPTCENTQNLRKVIHARMFWWFL